MKIKEAIRRSFTSRAFKAGGYSTLSSVIVIAIAASVILAADSLPAKYTKLDITENALYSLSEQTKSLAEGLTEPVNIYLISESGREDEVLVNMLDKYESLSDKIKVTVKDPLIYPNFAAQYTTGQVYSNSLVVESAGKSKYIGADEIYKTGYNNEDGTTVAEFYGESSITGAIGYVTADSLPKLYVLKGHGESPLTSSVISAIQNESISHEEISLLSVDGIPKDADCVLIYEPQSDISDREKALLEEYLDRGGELMVFTGYTGKALDNLYGLMGKYGAECENAMVLEGDGTMCLQGYNYYLLPDFSVHETTVPLIDNGYYVLAPLSQIIRLTDNGGEDVTVTELLTTSSKSYAKRDGYNMKTADKEEGDIEGPFTIGVAISDKKTKADILWIASSQMLDDTVNQLVSGGNQDLFLNALNWMCGREEGITIHAKALDQKYLTVTGGAVANWSFLFIFVIPAGVLGVGIYVWQRRKNR